MDSAQWECCPHTCRCDRQQSVVANFPTTSIHLSQVIGTNLDILDSLVGWGMGWNRGIFENPARNCPAKERLPGTLSSKNDWNLSGFGEATIALRTLASRREPVAALCFHRLLRLARSYYPAIGSMKDWFRLRAPLRCKNNGDDELTVRLRRSTMQATISSAVVNFDASTLNAS